MLAAVLEVQQAVHQVVLVAAVVVALNRIMADQEPMD
jgi:hypothetical protein